MPFISATFAGFIILFSILYYSASALKHRAVLFQRVSLLLASIVFYAFADLRFVPFLAFIIVLTWVASFSCRNKYLLAFFIVLDVAPLLFFKYSPTHWIFPLGISFFTLQSISFIVDSYRKLPSPCPESSRLQDLFDVALFISFFPTISSGPIQRRGALIPQFHKVHAFDYQSITDGMKLFAWGLFKKIVIADRIAIYIDYVYERLPAQYGCALLLSAILYSFQIYADFSGYSDMSIGIAKAFGFNLDRNFDRPYFSKTAGEFWHRWHISLSTWLRDYIYIPLGGSRVRPARIYLNLFVTFIVSGIWHGSTLNFLVWGLLHAFYQCMERLTKNVRDKMRIPHTIQILFTFCIITFAWIFFRANTIQDALFIIKKIAFIPSELAQFSALRDTLGTSDALRTLFTLFNDACKGFKGMIRLLITITVFVICEYITRNESGLIKIRRQHTLVRWLSYTFLILVIWILHVDSYAGNFIYQNF